MPVTYAVVGGGVVGSAVALALARRGRAVTLFEAEKEVGLAASGTNSGILHTGFDSHLGELETALILRAAPLRDEAIRALSIPVRRCGARMRDALPEVEQNAQMLGVPVVREGNDLLVPGESVTNPVAMTRALCAEAERVGASLRLGQRVTDDLPDYNIVVNCAGLFADEVARRFGDDSFAIAPRKGEFLVFPDTDPGLAEILLPVPTPRTKGILVFPTLDAHVCCGPTAVDMTDKSDWSVREEAVTALREQARGMLPRLAAEPLFAYAGLRPAGANGENYVIGWSRYTDRLLNVAAIRSTGLTAALGIADHVCADLLGIGSTPVPYARGAVSDDGLWWRRTAEYRGLA
jgi:glycerol-3-phosphate dehydrogenase